MVASHNFKIPKEEVYMKLSVLDQSLCYLTNQDLCFKLSRLAYQLPEKQSLHDQKENLNVQP